MLVAMFALSSCSSGVVPFEIGSQPPKLSQATRVGVALKQLPKAKNKTVVATYKFNDQTGQHKPNGNFSEYSRAVTQGGLPVLNQALYDAANQGWFTVLERENLTNLIQERNIISKMRMQYKPANGKKLPPIPPMLYSGMILEGGIVSYESDTLTGGLGGKYLGIGGSTEYRQDVVTVYLRAVSVKTGEILLSVNSSKTIYSAGLSAGAFKFLSIDKLLEIETGVTVNEPPQLPVKQAIEMAVYSLIMEGSIKNLWKFEDDVVGQVLVDDYVRRRNEPYEDFENVFEVMSSKKLKEQYLQIPENEGNLSDLQKVRRRILMTKKIRQELEKADKKNVVEAIRAHKNGKKAIDKIEERSIEDVINSIY